MVFFISSKSTAALNLNGFNNSNLEYIHCGVSQGSMLGPLLLLIYINDLNRVIRYCSVHHLADDRNLLNWLTNWLNVNKICPNISKTEVVLFKSSRKLPDAPLKLKLKWEKTLPY